VDADPPAAAQTTTPSGDGIVVSELTVRYQGTAEPAIANISCEVRPGTGLCVTGPEGAGKSTLLRALVGLVPPLRGSVSVLGGSPQMPALRTQIGYAPDRLPFPRGLRVSDAVRLVGAIRGVTDAPALALEQVGLPPHDRRIIWALELGEVRRVSLACAITGSPRALILDDPWEYPETVDVIRRALADGVTIVVGTLDPGGFPKLLGATLTLAQGAPV
jgi:ABC-type multidrug transport system ATPase subunit